jgi:hypothetical protein
MDRSGDHCKNNFWTYLCVVLNPQCQWSNARIYTQNIFDSKSELMLALRGPHNGRAPCSHSVCSSIKLTVTLTMECNHSSKRNVRYCPSFQAKSLTTFRRLDLPLSSGGSRKGEILPSWARYKENTSVLEADQTSEILWSF